MTALEIRPDEIGQFDLAAYRARRARMMAAKPPTPVIILKPARERLGVTLYPYAIGPTRPVPKLDFSRPLYANCNDLILRRCKYYARNQRQSHPLDKQIYLRPIGPIFPVMVIAEIEKQMPVWRDVITLKRREPPGISALQIIDEVCRKYGVEKNDLLSRRRTGILCVPRFEAAYRMRNETRLSTPQMGRLLCRDHTSIINAIRKYERLLAEGKVTADRPLQLAAE